MREITEQGIVGDRIIQVRNAAGRIFSARTRPKLLRHTAILPDNGDVLVDGRPWDSKELLSRLSRQQARGPAWSAATPGTASIFFPCWSPPMACLQL